MKIQFRGLFSRIRTAWRVWKATRQQGDRKSTRLNSSHGYISYAVFCLKKQCFIFGGHIAGQGAHPPEHLAQAIARAADARAERHVAGSPPIKRAQALSRPMLLLPNACW